MKHEIKTTLEQLSQLDLSAYPYNQTKDLITQLGNLGCIIVTLHQGKTLVRARPNYNDERFFSKCQLTYKPQEFNKAYQRASTPNMTMFYASLIPETIQKGELDNNRIIGAFEALPWLRDKTTKGYQKITFGRWRVIKDINLIAIVHHSSYHKSSSYTRELFEAYKKFINNYPNLEEETNAISDFFAKEFAKAETKNDFDYFLSALYSETISNKGFDGVLYPSVRVNGDGFNVAIRPEIADLNLELEVVGECSIYKYYENSFMDNETVALLKPNQTSFDMLPVEKEYHAGQEECLRMIGVKTMDELK